MPYANPDDRKAHFAKPETRAKINAYVAAKRRELWDRIAALKEAGACADCRGSFPAVCMDYDHVGADKTDCVSMLANRRAPWAKIQEEIDKCELVCANCHRLRTQARATLPDHS